VGGSSFLWVGLGNPGARFQGTRHNIGFALAERLSKRFLAPGQAAPARDSSLGVLHAVRCGQRQGWTLQPQLFMNLSGEPVVQTLQHLGLNEGQMLVACDDIHLPLGKLRLRPAGGPGGHNGLSDIIRALGHDRFARLRMGVGKPEPHQDLAEFVLAPFPAPECPLVEKVLDFAVEAAKMWLLEEMQPLMAAVNGSDLRTDAAPSGTLPLHQD